MARKEIPELVLQILRESAKTIGLYEEGSFGYDMGYEIQDVGLESPIEQALYIALATVARINMVGLCVIESEGFCTGGILVTPQVQIQNYRVDFMVAYYGYGDPAKTKVKEVVVECDGTAFHERTESERRQEKRRDRFMQKRGLKVFRFTGKEILDDPYLVAKEIIGYVTEAEEDTQTPAEYFGE